jgi:hypothetical protein
VLHQLESDGRAVAGTDGLVGRRWRSRGQAGLVVAPVLEPEAVEPSLARLEENDDRRQIVGAANAIGDVIAAARVGPAGVALLVARGKLDDLRAPLRPPRARRLMSSENRTSWNAMAQCPSARPRPRGRCRRSAGGTSTGRSFLRPHPASATAGNMSRPFVMIRQSSTISSGTPSTARSASRARSSQRVVSAGGARHDACADDVVDRHRDGRGRLRVVAHEIAHPVAQ